MIENEVKYKVSVVIPSYNYGKYIHQAIDSVLEQAGVMVDVVVVDDGSTDNTCDILRSYGNKIRWFKQQNAGVSSARNLGIKESKYNLITFLDADDWLLEDSLFKRCAFLKSHPECDWVYGPWQVSNDKGKIIGTSMEMFGHAEGILKGDVFPSLLRGYAGINTLTPMFRTIDVRESGGYNLDYKAAEDYDFLLKMSKGRFVGYCSESFLGIQRIHDSLLTGDPKLRFEAEISILSRLSEDFEIKNLMGDCLDKRIANLYNYLACIYHSKHQLSQCLSACIQSIIHKPMQRFIYLVLFYISTDRRHKVGELLENDLMTLYENCKNDSVEK